MPGWTITLNCFGWGLWEWLEGHVLKEGVYMLEPDTDMAIHVRMDNRSVTNILIVMQMVSQKLYSL